MQQIDIRKYKNEIRQAQKAKRAAIEPDKKAEWDEKIHRNFLKLYQYRPCKTVFAYMSKPIEVSTKAIIESVWADSKRVAVPRCIDGTRQMMYHYIESFDDVEEGSFSVLEPFKNLPVAEDYSSSILIMPALAVDRNGFRLGYGKGYYDRFLSDYNGVKVILCYSDDIRRHMYHGRFDRPADIIVTEKSIMTIKKRNA